MSEGPFSDAPLDSLDSFTRSPAAPRRGATETFRFRWEVSQRCGRPVPVRGGHRCGRRVREREASKRVEGRPFSSGKGSTLTWPRGDGGTSWAGRAEGPFSPRSPQKRKSWGRSAAPGPRWGHVPLTWPGHGSPPRALSFSRETDGKGARERAGGHTWTFLGEEGARVGPLP